jgi:hypothetical protein
MFFSLIILRLSNLAMNVKHQKPAECGKIDVYLMNP